MSPVALTMTPWLISALLAGAQAPVPRPFPGASQPPASPAAPVVPAVPTVPAQAAPGGPGSTDEPTEAQLGLPLYPGAQFIRSYDAGRGQRYYIFGTSNSFLELVTYYRTALKQRGELVYDAPATHEFDVGRFREETMAFPPGVTIKEYKSEISEGYPNPRPGGSPARFPTIIQIVPVVPDR